MPCANCPNALPPLTEPEKVLLAKLPTYAYLPVCRFLVRSPENPELSFVMSAPVYLEAEDSAPDAVKTWGGRHCSCCKSGAISPWITVSPSPGRITTCTAAPAIIRASPSAALCPARSRTWRRAAWA